MDMIEIDGSFGESGGQILRTALTLSSITHKPFRIFNVRAKRSNPGLRAQHLTACKAIRNVCRGTLKGAELGSEELVFQPGEIIGGEYQFNIGTAGSVTLVAQTLLPILMNAKKESIVRIIGGTHVIRAPTVDYFTEVFIPAVRFIGVSVDATLKKAGYYPRGGGVFEIRIKPSEVRGKTQWKRENHTKVLITYSNLQESIAIREKKVFIQHGIEDVCVVEREALDKGNAVLAWRGFVGFSSLGEIGKRAESVAEEAIRGLNEEGDVDVDRHMADQIILYLSLAKEGSCFETSQITSHLETNIEILKKFVDREIRVEKNRIEVV